MFTNTLIAVILLFTAVLMWFRPQSYNMYRRYDDPMVRERYRLYVRRWGTLGLVVTAAVVMAGSYMLAQRGVEDRGLTVFGMVWVFVGAISMTVKIELFNEKKS